MLIAAAGDEERLRSHEGLGRIAGAGAVATGLTIGHVACAAALVVGIGIGVDETTDTVASAALLGCQTRPARAGAGGVATYLLTGSFVWAESGETLGTCGARHAAEFFALTIAVACGVTHAGPGGLANIDVHATADTAGLIAHFAITRAVGIATNAVFTLTVDTFIVVCAREPIGLFACAQTVTFFAAHTGVGSVYRQRATEARGSAGDAGAAAVNIAADTIGALATCTVNITGANGSEPRERFAQICLA